MAARSSAEQTVDSLGLAALSTHGVLQRDALLGAQYELNRKLALFAMTFDEALATDIARQIGALTPTPQPGRPACPTPEELVASWDALSLVEDHEVELHLSADRFAREIGNACEWELRELDAYLASLLHMGHGGQRERNPLRAEVIGQALVRAVEVVCERPEVRKVLCTEIGRALAQAMRQTYTDIVVDLRGAGIKPMGMTVRQTASHGRTAPAPLSDTGQGDETVPAPGIEPPTARMASLHAGMPTASSRRTAGAAGRNAGRPTAPGMAGLGEVDAGLMALIRRLTDVPLASPRGPGAAASGDSASAWGDGTPNGAPADGIETGGFASGWAGGQAPMVAPNLILAHRDALRQAATGTLDHLVIDVVGGLFDQILSDPRVPPQIARLIARLQLPVLRAALGDASFFSSRRHPVRRFINRVASLGAATDDFEAPDGRALLDTVTRLVQQIVEGDFEQIDLYERQLDALEVYAAEQAQAALRDHGEADRLLARKEDELRVQQHYAQQMDGALEDLPLQDYLRRFLATVWSRVIASAEMQADDAGVELARRLRDTGRELVMSVQPKGTPALRQTFLRRLPQLMKDLNQGLDRIGCADEVRREFFARLLPAHADSLKGLPLSTLEMNLLARQVDGVLDTPVPRPAELPPVTPAASAQLREQAGDQVFTPAEAQAVGLVREQSVDWNGKLDIDLGAEPELTAVDIDIDGLPPPEPVEPSRGKSLVDHVQIGFAYRMHLEGQWQKVRLTHISPARTFFVFAHGHRCSRSLSLTHRMLTRLCDAGRLRAFENAWLLERATARARRQLALLTPKKR